MTHHRDQVFESSFHSRRKVQVTKCCAYPFGISFFPKTSFPKPLSEYPPILKIKNDENEQRFFQAHSKRRRVELIVADIEISITGLVIECAFISAAVNVIGLVYLTLLTNLPHALMTPGSCFILNFSCNSEQANDQYVAFSFSNNHHLRPTWMIADEVEASREAFFTNALKIQNEDISHIKI